MESSRQQRDSDIAQAALNATIANLCVNLLIMGQVQEQIALQKEAMESQARFQQNLLQTLDRIINNQ